MTARKTSLLLDHIASGEPCESDPQTSPLGGILLKCLARLRSWKPPPNWSASGWFDELQQLACIAACEALCDYHVGATTSPEAFVYLRIMERVLTSYRREWSYALRFVPDLRSGSVADDDQCETKDGNVLEARAEMPAPRHEMLHEALGSLPATERCVIEELFWAGRTEEELGRMLGATQRTISRRKRAALRSLRDRLIVT